MGCVALVRCVLVLHCGLAVVVWYPYAGFSLHTDTTPPYQEIIKQVTLSWSLFTQESQNVFHPLREVTCCQMEVLRTILLHAFFIVTD